VARVCREARGVVLIDEAYVDFADDDLLGTVLASGNAVVLRTFSKAFGLAGLRLGYAVGPVEVIAEIEKSRGPYNVSGAAEAAALAVLGRDQSWVRECVAQVRRNRDRLAAELQARGARVWPSAANFVLVSVPGLAAEWNRALRGAGVAVRPFAALPHAGEALRVTAGPWPMLQRFLDAFDEILPTIAERTWTLR
jgi:histidinol-phosphate aminotransferase